MKILVKCIMENRMGALCNHNGRGHYGSDILQIVTFIMSGDVCVC